MCCFVLNVTFSICFIDKRYLPLDLIETSILGALPSSDRHFKLLCLNFGNLAVLVNLIPVLSFLDFSKPVLKEPRIVAPFR